MPPRRRVARAASGKPNPTANPASDSPRHDASEALANANSSFQSSLGGLFSGSSGQLSSNSRTTPAKKEKRLANVSKADPSSPSKTTPQGIVDSKAIAPSISPSKRLAPSQPENLKSLVIEGSIPSGASAQGSHTPKKNLPNKASPARTLQKKRKRRTPGKSTTMAPSSLPSPSRTPAPPTNSQTPISLDDVSPALFDIVPATERLLSRLLLPSGDTSAPTAGGGSTMENEPEYKRPLDISHLDAAANPIRVKFAKLRQLIPRLPDIDRTVEEQREEIEEIEARIDRQKSMLSNLERMMNGTGQENGESKEIGKS